MCFFGNFANFLSTLFLQNTPQRLFLFSLVSNICDICHMYQNPVYINKYLERVMWNCSKSNESFPTRELRVTDFLKGCQGWKNKYNPFIFSEINSRTQPIVVVCFCKFLFLVTFKTFEVLVMLMVLSLMSLTSKPLNMRISEKKVLKKLPQVLHVPKYYATLFRTATVFLREALFYRVQLYESRETPSQVARCIKGIEVLININKPDRQQ